MKKHANLLLIGAALWTGVCAADPVHELAAVTAANVGVLGTRLKQLADESNLLYAQRAANVAGLHAENARTRAEYAYDIALIRKAGDQADLELVKELENWVAEVDKIFADAANAEKERREALLASQVRIDTKVQALQKIAESLSTLAGEESRSERIKALQSFASAVAKDVKKALESGDESAKAAKALLDKVSGN